MSEPTDVTDERWLRGMARFAREMDEAAGVETILRSDVAHYDRAADAVRDVAALRAENERLRAALVRLRDCWMPYPDCDGQHGVCMTEEALIEILETP